VVTLPWLAAWAPHLNERYGDEKWLGKLFAAAISGGGREADEVFSTLAASVRNEHEVGSMGRHVTEGLLAANRPEGWELMEKILQLLDDGSARAKAIAGKDAEDRYLALWAIAYEDAPAAIAAAKPSLESKQVEHRFAAAVLLAQLDLTEAKGTLEPVLEDADL